MKKSHTIIITILIGTTLSGAALAVQAQSNENDALAIKSANITMNEAVKIALSTVSGTPVKAEFGNEEGQLFWEVEVLNVSQQTIDLEIDALTGNIIKQQADNVDHEENDGEEDDSENDES